MGRNLTDIYGDSMEGYRYSQDEYPAYGNDSQDYTTTTYSPYAPKTAAYRTTHYQETPRERVPVSNTSTSKYITNYNTSYSTPSNTNSTYQYSKHGAISNHDTSYAYNEPPSDSSTSYTPHPTTTQSNNTPYYSTSPENNTDPYYSQNYDEDYDDFNSPHTSRDPNADRAGDAYAQDEISKFVDTFQQKRKQYLKLEKEIGTNVKQKLNERKIEYLWQSRVKEPHSLEAKLRNRTRTIQYKNDQKSNCAAIKDLIACRIILPWLKRDLPVVKSLITKYFKLVGETKHPKPGSSSGYAAHHFYMTMKSTGLSNVTIEIQVMSPFTYGYMAQEHDIRYKQLQGVITLDDIINLEKLQSAAQQGNAASKQLQQGRYIE